MTKQLKFGLILSTVFLASCGSSTNTIGPEDAIDLICQNCTIRNGAALIGGCPQSYAELKIKEGTLTVNYMVDCGSGVQKATESGTASDLKLIHSDQGNYIQGKWTDRGDMLSDADLKLVLNKNWEYTYGKQLTLALYNKSGNWEYQFTWSETDSTLNEFCKIMYSENELIEINKRRMQRIPLDYQNASDVEILGFILNSKWSNGNNEAIIGFDENTNTLSFRCNTDYGNETYYLGAMRFEREFNRYIDYQNLNFFQKGFWSNYLVPHNDPPTLLESKGLILESSGGRIYFDAGGFFNNIGPKDTQLDKATLVDILSRLKTSSVNTTPQSANPTPKTETIIYNEEEEEAEYSF